jgi:hypothetical protein
MTYQYNPVFNDDEEFNKVKKFYDGLEKLAERTPEGELIDEGVPERFWGYDDDLDAYLTREERSDFMASYYSEAGVVYRTTTIGGITTRYDIQGNILNITDEQIEAFKAFHLQENKKLGEYVDYFMYNATIIYESKVYLSEYKPFNSLEECIEYVEDLKNQGYTVFLKTLSLQKATLKNNHYTYRLGYIAIKPEEVN